MADISAAKWAVGHRFLGSKSLAFYYYSHHIRLKNGPDLQHLINSSWIVFHYRPSRTIGSLNHDSFVVDQIFVLSVSKWTIWNECIGLVHRGCIWVTLTQHFHTFRRPFCIFEIILAKGPDQISNPVSADIPQKCKLILSVMSPKN